MTKRLKTTAIGNQRVFQEPSIASIAARDAMIDQIANFIVE
jgi:hypothetical protein